MIDREIAMKKWKWIIAMAMMSGLSGLAHAAPYCFTINPTGPLKTAEYNFDANKIPPFNPNVPDGTLLLGITLESDNVPPPFWIRCVYPIFSLSYWHSPLPAYGVNQKMFQSGIEGVAVKIASSGKFLPIDSRDAYYPEYEIGVGGGNKASVMLQFYKIGPITGKGRLSGEFAFHSVTSLTDKVVSYRWSGDLQIKAPTCNAAAATQNVDLGTYSTKKFTGIGSTSDLKPFAINLICSGGDESVDAKLYMTLTDVTYQSNTSNTLNLSSDSTAKGLGIQVFKDSTLLSYGPDSSVAGNKNQWYAGTTGNGFFSIPLSARFIQTSPTVTAGKAKGRMTFTLSYQ
ncbi:type 1 fimbrial protein [Burkholderia cepacia]|uniref:fimbrial protein n=1 Tax=Burkholderia TaxID=32008 RepID=UPI000F5F3748|nr:MULTISPECIES: fimbrial protein [Burkholderia]MCA7933141.1 type 1 fimbrial protein [Burkholderia cepacia]MCA8218892.1 type 1 fimbrial protein [Burkholderia cepacia]NTX23131.1 type 1 fimbrial protein [Burkholderia cepacia]TEV65213.1 type 1 fimbrial protein [Burkholderia cepacia]THJ48662.1 type 1 fimbrial protein [Burkholderia sp. LS-044]